MATFFEDWEGYTTGEQPTGYTAQLSQGTLRVETDSASDDVLRASNLGASIGWLTPDSVPAGSTRQQSVSVGRRNATADLGVWDVNAFVRADTAAVTAYAAGVYDGTNFRLVALVDGAQSVIGTTAFTYALDELVAIRVEADGTAISAKVWKWADAEPASWTVTGTNSAIASGKPAVGLRAGGMGSTDYTLFSAGTDGDVAPLAESGQLAIPSGFTFTAAAGARQLDGSWSAVSGASTYDWEVEEDVSGTWTAFGSGNTATTAFQLTDTDGVKWATSYRGRVRAVPA